jgi:D-apionolactonase
MNTEKLLSENILLYGSNAPLPPQIPLQAGPLQMVYEEGKLRYLKAGDTELVRMIYVALRDKRWGTYISHITNEKIDIQPDSFCITYTCSYYNQKRLLFSWDALISGNVSGNIYFEMNGKADADFEKNRLGICILHPIEPLKGKKITITHPDLSQNTGVFPESVSPHQPFKNIRSMKYYPEENSTVTITFSGDIFEMEDQRNWTDASYKTYSTPLEIPIPAKVKKGDTFFQSVAIQVTGFSPANQMKAICTLFPDWNSTGSLPAIGIRQSSEYNELHAEQISLLKNCRFDHYRIDVHLHEPDWKGKLQTSLQEARQLNTGVEIALHLNNANDLQGLFDIASEIPLIKSIILYFPDALLDQKQREEIIQLCKQRIAKAEIGIGTKDFFADINRSRPTEGNHDFMVFSVNPQVHAFDNSTIIENLEAQKYPIETIQSFTKDKKIHISPLEFRMSFMREDYSEDILPFQPDSRQLSLFAAGWTLGSIKYLAESSVASATCFETVGRKGIMAGEQENSDAEFPAFRGMIYPVYYIFRELAEMKDATVIACSTDLPLQVSSLLLKKDDQLLLFLANHTQHEVAIDLTALGQTWMAKQISASNIQTALLSPTTYEQLTFTPVDKRIMLAPFAFAMLYTVSIP